VGHDKWKGRGDTSPKKDPPSDRGRSNGDRSDQGSRGSRGGGHDGGDSGRDGGGKDHGKKR
jgi:hypothetical protein